MVRKSLLAGSVLLSASAHALDTGDIAFTSFNADEDGWSIVALADIAAGDTLFFTENDWNNATGSFDGGEAFYTWTLAGQPLAAGSTVRFSSVNNAGRSASVGDFSARQRAALSVGGDSLVAYVGSADTTPGTFLAAISSDGFDAGQLDGTGLAPGVTALGLPGGTDYAEYVGPRSGLGSFDGYAGLLNDVSQWRVEASGDFSGFAPSMAPFAVTAAVPEPETYALMLSGLGLLGIMLRGRSDRI